MTSESNNTEAEEGFYQRYSATIKALGASVVVGAAQLFFKARTGSPAIFNEAMHNIFIDAGFYACFLGASHAKDQGHETFRKALLVTAGSVAVASSVLTGFEAWGDVDNHAPRPPAKSAEVIATLTISALANRKIHKWYVESGVRTGTGHRHARNDKWATAVTLASSFTSPFVGPFIESGVSMVSSGLASFDTANEARYDYLDKDPHHAHHDGDHHEH